MKKNKNKKMQDHKRSYSKLPGSLEDRKANTKLRRFQVMETDLPSFDTDSNSSSSSENELSLTKQVLYETSQDHSDFNAKKISETMILEN
ncbi:unnamed protein product [Cuscuta epithymum]|uniref:Uncharacterized protein n=1 Tax=Cuscuta epithymum TaxID=186058 RepID=A0AAV0C6X3_9ASTE|nr:unnamed protein product [Cuscuta epithymum]